MAFITALLARWGLKALVPYILPTVIGLLISGGIGTAWWLGYGDFPSLLLGAAILVLVASFFSIETKLLQAVALAFILIGSLLLGRHIENKETEAKVQQAIEATSQRIHKSYRDAAAKEQERQRKEAEEARKRAEAERANWERTIENLYKQIDQLQNAADRDMHAERPSLSLESVDRLNQLRGNEPLRQ